MGGMAIGSVSGQVGTITPVGADRHFVEHQVAAGDEIGALDDAAVIVDSKRLCTWATAGGARCRHHRPRSGHR
jgi:hypothetical protein